MLVESGIYFRMDIEFVCDLDGGRVVVVVVVVRVFDVGIIIFREIVVGDDETSE